MKGRTHNGGLIDTAKIKKTSPTDLFKELDVPDNYIEQIPSLFKSNPQLRLHQLQSIYCTIKYKRFAKKATTMVDNVPTPVATFLVLRDLGLIKKQMLFVAQSMMQVAFLMDEIEKWTDLKYQSFPTNLEFDEEADIIIGTYDALRIAGTKQLGSRKQNKLNNDNIDAIRNQFDFVVYNNSHLLSNPKTTNVTVAKALTDPKLFEGYLSVIFDSSANAADVSKFMDSNVNSRWWINSWEVSTRL